LVNLSHDALGCASSQKGLSMLVASLLPHRGDRVIAFIDFVKSLRWPAVAALLVLQLDPIRRPIESLRGNGAGVVRLGDIACRVTPHALPQPNEDIVRGRSDGRRHPAHRPQYGPERDLLR
jgi:hypothetical protein